LANEIQIKSGKKWEYFCEGTKTVIKHQIIKKTKLTLVSELIMKCPLCIIIPDFHNLRILPLLIVEGKSNTRKRQIRKSLCSQLLSPDIRPQIATRTTFQTFAAHSVFTTRNN
jgi:hypothetical protein